MLQSVGDIKCCSYVFGDIVGRKCCGMLVGLCFDDVGMGVVLDNGKSLFGLHR